MQHNIVIEMRRKLKKRPGGTVVAYARETNQDETRLGRLMRGEIVMRLEDIASIRRHLGPDQERAV